MQESNSVTNAKQETNKPQETRLIHCYDLLSFVAEIEKAVKDGFSLDFKDNTRCPVMIGYQLITTMVKEEPEEVKTVAESPTEDVKTPLEAPESTQEGAGSQEVTKEAVEAPKRAEAAAQDVKAKPGRKAKAVQ